MGRKKKKTIKRRLSSGKRKSIQRKSPSSRFPFDVGSKLREAFQYHQTGQLREAERIYRRILKIQPRHLESLHLLGVIHHQLGKTDIAVNFYNKAIQNNPQSPILHYSLGTAFQDQGKLDEAISCYQEALKLKPDLVTAHYSMGIAFQIQGRSDEAISCYQQALTLKPDLLEAYNNMAFAFHHQGKLDETISCLENVLDLRPDFGEACNRLVHQLQLAFAWHKLERMIAKLDGLTKEALGTGKRPAKTPFRSITLDSDPSHSLAIARSWSSEISRRMSTMKIDFSFDASRSYKRRIAIGYLSNDFRDHAAAHLLLSLFRLHNRNEFKIFCYSYGEDDGSHYRVRIRQDCDNFVDLRNLDHVDAAKRIYQDQVDIVVDLMGYTTGSRLEICALRPAPIQVSYLGFPGTTGADFFDYIITDRIVTPEDHAAHFSENFVYMPHCFQVNDHTQAMSNKAWRKADFGLPETGFIFCSFNNSYKIEPVMFDVWMKILRQIPKSVLWLRLASQSAKENLRREAEDRGVAPERLVFSKRLPLDEHLARLRLADLALDTRIYNGGATTSNALWAGVPVVTLTGSHFPSRMSSSILTAIGLPELITCSLDDYETLAIRLARYPEQLRILCEKLARNRLEKPLFDTPRFVRNLEKAYKKMWNVFLAGEKPRQIDVVEDSNT